MTVDTADAPAPLAAPPTGPMEYGQAGQYNAVDDREVITALSGGKTGVAIAPTMVAASQTIGSAPPIATDKPSPELHRRPR